MASITQMYLKHCDTELAKVVRVLAGKFNFPADDAMAFLNGGAEKKSAAHDKKEVAKAAKLAEKEAAKAAKLAEKEAAKAAKLAEKEAAKAAKLVDQIHELNASAETAGLDFDQLKALLKVERKAVAAAKREAAKITKITALIHDLDGHADTEGLDFDALKFLLKTLRQATKEASKEEAKSILKQVNSTTVPDDLLEEDSLASESDADFATLDD